MDILDISRLTDTVDVRGHEVEVIGLEFQAVGNLVYRFPELRKMIATQDFDMPSLFTMSDDVGAAIISAGTQGRITEQGARNLAFSEKMAIVSAMAPLTFTRGVGPFVEDLARFMVAASGPGAASAKAPSTNSRKPSNT